MPGHGWLRSCGCVGSRSTWVCVSVQIAGLKAFLPADTSWRHVQSAGAGSMVAGCRSRLPRAANTLPKSRAPIRKRLAACRAIQCRSLRCSPCSWPVGADRGAELGGLRLRSGPGLPCWPTGCTAPAWGALLQPPSTSTLRAPSPAAGRHRPQFHWRRRPAARQGRAAPNQQVRRRTSPSCWGG